MTRGIKTDTAEWVEAERALDPLALGPFVGALSFELGVPLCIVAKMIGVHEQTAGRWVRRRSPLNPKLIFKAVKVLSLLCWMHETKYRTLRGSIAQREAQLAIAFDQFLTASRNANGNRT